MEQQQQQQQQQHDPEPEVEASQPNDFGAWKPSIVIGSPLWLDAEDLSVIEIADRKVAMTRLWAHHYQGEHFAQVHQDAVREREQLDETAEINTQPRQAPHR